MQYKNNKNWLSIINILILLLVISLPKLKADEITTPITVAAMTPSTLISLNFQDIKVRAILQLLAEFADCNIVISDKVQGSLTLHLDKVPWNQALDIILQSQNLDKRQLGNVIWIAPAIDIATREKQALQTLQQIQDLGPLHSELIQINYGKAADIVNLLKGNSAAGSSGTNPPILSPRGSASFDSRTNTVWVQDTAQKVTDVHKLITQLDIPVRQVLISARIVNINSKYMDELGVRFGLSDGDHLTGTLQGANALASGVAPDAVPLAQRLNMDLPAVASGTIGGSPSIGLALTKLGSGVLLDLELSALETEGRGKIISSPQLVTADQQAALIESGEEIPYQQATTSGATSISFQKAVLSLNVTPQITPDGKLILTLAINQDTADFANRVQGVPPIDTRSINTQVLLNNGETIVLGGIYETNNNNQTQRVPFFGSLPLIGGLFRHTLVTNSQTELLIFITPKII